MNVSWNDALAFCQWLSEDQEGVEYALPTEAQWEYACRGGTTTPWCCGDSGTALEEYAWFRTNSGGTTRPAGRLQPNGWGLYDMHGSVWEWCADRWATDYYAQAGTVGMAEQRYAQAMKPVEELVVAWDFSEALTALGEVQFEEGDLLTNLDAKYADTPWLASNRAAMEALRGEARAGIYEAEAEKLYAKAVELLETEQPFDVEPVVKNLKANFGDSVAVTETTREPSFSEIEEAIADLGKRFTVRLDGEGDFKSIQAAIDQAPPNSLIEIQDNGPYFERILVPKEKEGLTLRGAKDRWPVVRSGGTLGTVSVLVTVDAPRTTVKRLVIAKEDAEGSSLAVVNSCHLRSVLWAGRGECRLGRHLEIDGCLSTSRVCVYPSAVLRNSIWINSLTIFGGEAKERIENVVIGGKGLTCAIPLELRHCTVDTELTLETGDGVIVDSILDSVQAAEPGNSIENCNIGSGKFVDFAKPGKSGFSANPQFVNPELYDHRLMPTSPCRGKASDGGDLGVRYTPEMVEILKVALALRQQGLIKF